MDNFPIKKFQLINIINKNPNNLKKITKIIHPIVRKEMKLFLKKNQNKKAVVLDIPLFLENNLDHKNDILVFIDPDKKKAILRLKRRTNFNKRNCFNWCRPHILWFRSARATLSGQYGKPPTKTCPRLEAAPIILLGPRRNRRGFT